MAEEPAQKPEAAEGIWGHSRHPPVCSWNPKASSWHPLPLLSALRLCAMPSPTLAPTPSPSTKPLAHLRFSDNKAPSGPGRWLSSITSSPRRTQYSASRRPILGHEPPRLCAPGGQGPSLDPGPAHNKRQKHAQVSKPDLLLPELAVPLAAHPVNGRVRSGITPGGEGSV